MDRTGKPAAGHTPPSKLPSGTSTAAARKRLSVTEAKKRARRKKNKRHFFAFCICVIALLCTAFVVYDKLFVIDSFAVRGEKEYTAEQAETFAKAIGIEPGMHLFSFDREKASANAKYALSEFDSVKIRYDLPSGIVLEVKESVPILYITFGGHHFILSEGLRVLSMTDDASVPESMALKHVAVGGVSGCVAGEFLQTDSGCDEILISLLAVLKEEGVLAEATEIDVSDKFAIRFDYKQRYTVLLGDSVNMSVKVRLFKAIEQKLRETDSGYIDVSDENYREGQFKPYNR